MAFRRKTQKMKNEEVYKETLAKSSETRFTLNEDHHPRIKKLSEIFSRVFGEEGKIFKLIEGMLYYTGGYPSENSPPRLDELVERFANVCRYYAFIDKDIEITNLLEKHSIVVNITKMKNDAFKPTPEDKEAIKKLFKELNIDESMPQTKLDLFNKIMNEALDEQKIICQLADTIKIDDASVIDEQCEIIKSAYIKAVNMKYKEMKDKSIDKDVQRIDKTVQSLTEVINNI